MLAWLCVQKIFGSTRRCPLNPKSVKPRSVKSRFYCIFGCYLSILILDYNDDGGTTASTFQFYT
jgi:hypothetical protein